MPESSNTPATDTKRLHAIVHGYVQGVGFRAATQRRAADLRLTGWVRNRWDGTVEVVAEGPQAALDDLKRFLRNGPSSATVDQVDDTTEPATGEFSGFNIRYTSSD